MFKLEVSITILEKCVVVDRSRQSLKKFTRSSRDFKLETQVSQQLFVRSLKRSRERHEISRSLGPILLQRSGRLFE